MILISPIVLLIVGMELKLSIKNPTAVCVNV